MLLEYLEELKKVKMLGREEETALWEKNAAGDEEAHQKLITSYQPLVFKVAMSFRLPEDTVMELIQEGMVGLLEAAESFDHTRGVAFSLFAVHRIRGRMCDFLSSQSARGDLSLEWDRYGGGSLADVLTDPGLEPEEIAERRAVCSKVAGAVERLPVKEQKVLKGIFLENRTPADLAEDINVTPGHVYRLEKQGVRRIRGMLGRFIGEFSRS